MIQAETLSAPEKYEGRLQDNADGCNYFYLKKPVRLTLVRTLSVQWSFTLLYKDHYFCNSKNNKSSMKVP